MLDDRKEANHVRQRQEFERTEALKEARKREKTEQAADARVWTKEARRKEK
jgi:hypothetical protein